jgi:hypothetical protein
MDALGVYFFEKVAVEFIIRGAGAKAFEVRLAARVEFGFFAAHAAAGAI